MPSGRVHTLINFSVLAAGVVLWHVVTPPLTDVQGLSLAVGVVIGTVWITPDLDMRGVRVDAQKNWAWLGWIWTPLRRLSRHRGVSHTYVRGPLLRVAYLALVVTLLLLAGRLVTRTPWNSPLPGLSPPLSEMSSLSPLLLWSYGGYHAAQILHLLADRIPLSVKRL